MSVVSDLREALQDIVAPDLKAVVRGLADLTEEVRDGNKLLREEMKAGNALLRDEMKAGDALLREEMKAVEKRTGERIERVYDAVKISDLTRRKAQPEKELEQYRGSQAGQEPQQH